MNNITMNIVNTNGNIIDLYLLLIHKLFHHNFVRKYIMTGTPSNACIQCKCNIGIVIKKYLHPLLKLLQDDPELKDFDLTETTKCLNTSVLLMVFMAGKEKGMQVVNQCDTVRVTERHKNGIDNNNVILPYFSKKILSSKFSQRYVYYILLTDGWFKRKDGSDPVYFPGHVFIIEKEKDPITKKPVYYLYQSYINQYDLNGYFNNVKGNNKLRIKDVSDILNKLAYIVNNKTWDATCGAFWKTFTNVDTPEFTDTITEDSIFVCIRSVPLKTCMKNIERYMKDRLATEKSEHRRAELAKLVQSIHESKV
jgi:hypothetical protein